jgi:hypothetical protein
MIASLAGGALWYLRRRGFLDQVVLFLDECFVVGKERKHETQSCKVVPMPPSAFRDDSRFMAPGEKKPQDDTRFMPPEMVSARTRPSPPAPSPPRL